MYPKNETVVSHRHLRSVLEELRMDHCLIGGWAVYYLVNERYRNAHMKDYLGSRDIDLGFPDAGGLKAAGEILVGKMHFEHLSFRFVKYLNYDTGEELSAEEAKGLPLHMLVELFVDGLVPDCPPGIREELGFTPPDEPILARVFQDKGNLTTVNIAGRGVRVPLPELMLAMKLNSVVNRTKDHKRIKDICDIAALCLFTSGPVDQTISRGIANADPGNVKMNRTVVRDEDCAQASDIIGIPTDAMTSLFDRFSVI